MSPELKTTPFESCAEKSTLLQAYTDATREFSEKVAALKTGIGVTPKHEYALMEGAVEDARLKSEQARIAYERHVAGHGC